MKTDKFQKLQRTNQLCSEIDGLYHSASLKIGLSDSASRILYAIYTNGGECLLSCIYKESGISKQTVNSALRKLEQNDIIILKHHYGKSKIVSFTEKGRKFANNTVSKIVEAEIKAFEGWSDEELDTYLFYINKYVETFGEQVEKIQGEQDKNEH